MNIIKFLQERLFGKLIVLTITETSIRICQGRKSPKYELPKAFQGYNFLNHTEEMAGWLKAILREEKIRIRRCRIVLDSGQIHLQMVKLPIMTMEEQRNWVRWEGSRYVSFEPGTYQAVLLLWPDLGDSRTVQENRVIIAPDYFVNGQPAEEEKSQNFLLIAIPLEIIEALQRFAGFLKAKLEEVTALGPKQVVLPVNLLPVSPRKEVILKRGYQTATVLCLLTAMVLSVRGAISWQCAKSAWLEADRQLMPFHSVKEAYKESKETDYQIRLYQKTLQHISQSEPVWASALQTIGKFIPEGCWLVGLKQKQTKNRQLEIKGCAMSLAQVTDFLEKLEHSGVFSKARLVESGAQRIVLKDRGDNGKTVISFLLLAELAPEKEGVMP